MLPRAQTTLRSVLGEYELDDLLSNREQLNNRLQSILDYHTDPWGIKVRMVEVKAVDLPQEMQRAMSKQAEAEREKRAKVIHAQCELLSSQLLLEAAQKIAQEPTALQLRYLQTLSEIGVEKNTTVVFPLPIELMKAFGDVASSIAKQVPSTEKRSDNSHQATNNHRSLPAAEYSNEILTSENREKEKVYTIYSAIRLGVFQTPTTMAGRALPSLISFVMASSMPQSTPI